MKSMAKRPFAASLTRLVPRAHGLVLLTVIALLASICAAGQNKTKSKGGQNKTTEEVSMNRPRGCFVQQRIVWVPIPKYKYVDVPLAEPIYQKTEKKKKTKKKDKSTGIREVHISRYSSHYDGI